MAIVLALEPAWGNPIVEEYTWETQVLSSYTGVEQRLKLRSIPNRRVKFDMLEIEPEWVVALHDTLIYNYRDDGTLIPLWWEAVPTTAPVVGGATVLWPWVSGSGSNRSFQVGAGVMLFDKNGVVSVNTVAAIEAGGLRVTVAPTQSFATGALIMPLMMTAVTEDSVLRMVGRNAIEAAVTFDFVVVP